MRDARHLHKLPSCACSLRELARGYKLVLAELPRGRLARRRAVDEVALPAVDGRRVAKRDATLVGRAKVIWSTGDMAAVAHLEADAHTLTR